MDSFVEPIFGFDDFRKQKVLIGWEAVAQSVLIVLFGKPGFYPSIPELGMNIQQYRNMRIDQINTEAIKVELAYQCKSIQSGIIDGSIDVKKIPLGSGVAILITVPIEAKTTKNTVLIGLKMEDDKITYNYDLINASEVV